MPQISSKPFVSLYSIICATLISACASTGLESFQVRNLAKSDSGKVYELIVASQIESVNSLMVKLYRRNPRELAKAVPGTTIDSRLLQVFGNDGPHWFHDELLGKASIEALELAFSEHFDGDRVLAFTVGLGSMIMESYNNKTEFFILDHINPQKIYDSARNIEITHWRLNNKQLPDGGLMLISNSYSPTELNTSFDRLINRIIDYQGLVVDMLGGGSGRLVETGVRRLATAMFIPL
ncbi:MAG: hypothetical protein HOM55_02230 [Proteobacteria bacterium]|jgi:hypothetical protein|nr:hypothetical protein [Pseudomonadota bacterium]